MLNIVPQPIDEHRAQVLEWLLDEHREHGTGFYCNRGVIERGFRNSSGHCLVLDGYAIAFALVNCFDTEAVIDIMEVHPRHRRCGHGRLFTKHVLQYFSREGAKSVEVECTPETSEPFWRAMGFVDLDASDRRLGEPVRLKWIVPR